MREIAGLFTQETKVERISALQEQANRLMQQKKQVKHNKILKDAYTIAISRILQAVVRLSDQVGKEKPTDGNQ